MGAGIIYFFEYSFSSRIWRNVIYRCNVVNPPVIWDDVVRLGGEQLEAEELA
jgi:hypothetical protein